jgi:hypothetical protein
MTSGGNIGTTKTTPMSTSSSRSPATSAQRAQHSTASSQESGTSDANNSGTAAQAISFKDFRSLVEKSCNDIAFYKEQMGRIYQVPARTVGSHLFFNIEKSKDREKKKLSKSKSGDKVSLSTALLLPTAPFG